MAGDLETPLDILNGVKPELSRQGLRPHGPRTGLAPIRDHLTLADGRIVYAQLDREGCWQLTSIRACGSPR